MLGPQVQPVCPDLVAAEQFNWPRGTYINYDLMKKVSIMTPFLAKKVP
jgi:hypothetical protein